MGLGHSPQIVTRNLLLNLDFGNVQKCYNGSENLLRYSQDFSVTGVSNWDTGQATTSRVSNTIVAPDGTLTADKLVEGTSTTNFTYTFYQPNVISGSGNLCFSCFVKAAERRYVSLDIWDGNTIAASATFDLQTGTYLASGSTGGGAISVVDYGITQYPNGWYRCYFAANRSSITYIYSRISFGNAYPFAVYTGDGTSGIYVWGAQLETGRSPSPYFPTTTTTRTRPTTATSTIANYSHTINQSQYISYDGATNSIRFDRNETFASFTGSITSNVLTVTAMSGVTTITNGSALSYSGLTPPRYITSFGTGIGTTGTYNVNSGIDTTSRAMTSAYKVGGNMVVTASGPLASNTYLYNDHTTEIWARINDQSPANYDGYEGENILLAYPGYHCGFIYATGYLRYYIWTNTGPAALYPTQLTLGTSGTDIIVGRWFHVSVTKSGSTFKTYLNGVLKFTDTVSLVAFPSVTNALRLGAAGDGNTGAFYYYGKNNVGCVKMYNTALTADEISQNFNALRGRFGI